MLTIEVSQHVFHIRQTLCVRCARDLSNNKPQGAIRRSNEAFGLHWNDSNVGGHGLSTNVTSRVACRLGQMANGKWQMANGRWQMLSADYLAMGRHEGAVYVEG